MDELTKRYEQLVSEIAYLRKENDELKNNQMKHCIGCYWVKRHPCGAFMQCGFHDRTIDADADGCSWRK